MYKIIDKLTEKEFFEGGGGEEGRREIIGDSLSEACFE